MSSAKRVAVFALIVLATVVFAALMCQACDACAGSEWCRQL